VARYQGKLSGPLLDRIDLHVEVAALAPEHLLQTPPGETTASIRERCRAARELALQRQGKSNQDLSVQELDAVGLLEPGALQFLKAAAARLGWSARSVHRSLRVARSIADLAGCEATQQAHVAEAVQYRRALCTGA
jgi:magnesium chelatase family protein